jgi:hypothetical protein
VLLLPLLRLHALRGELRGATKLPPVWNGSSLRFLRFYCFCDCDELAFLGIDIDGLAMLLTAMVTRMCLWLDLPVGCAPSSDLD